MASWAATSRRGGGGRGRRGRMPLAAGVPGWPLRFNSFCTNISKSTKVQLLCSGIRASRGQRCDHRVAVYIHIVRGALAVKVALNYLLHCIDLSEHFQRSCRFKEPSHCTKLLNHREIIAPPPLVTRPMLRQKYKPSSLAVTPPESLLARVLPGCFSRTHARTHTLVGFLSVVHTLATPTQ